MVHLRLDQEIKRHAQQLAEELGFSLSSIINATLKEFIRGERLVVQTTPRMSYWLEEYLGPIERDIRKRKNLTRPIGNQKELREYFRSL